MGCRLMRAGLLGFALCGAAIPARPDQAGCLIFMFWPSVRIQNGARLRGMSVALRNARRAQAMGSRCTGFGHNMRRGGQGVEDYLDIKYVCIDGL
jgi:hypothetical protein